MVGCEARKVNQYDDGAGRTDETREQLQRIKLEAEQLKLKQLQSQFFDAAVVVHQMQDCHAKVKQRIYRLLDMLAALLPTDADGRVRQQFKEANQVLLSGSTVHSHPRCKTCRVRRIGKLRKMYET